MIRKFALMLASLVMSATMALPAWAADKAGAADNLAPLEEITVTGTRLSGNFASPTPVSVVDSARMEERASANIVDALNELPAFRGTDTPAASELRPEAGYVGGRILDLRGLGSVRTLTLVDGKRFVPSTTISTVDTNMIPGILLDRAEIVTGGASAQYGSDAVAGVANLLLNKKLNGVKTSMQQGISRYGDNADLTVGVAGGTQLSDNVHVVVGLEYENSHGVGDCQARPWCQTETLNFGRNPGVTTMPANNILPNIRPSTVPFNGVTVPTGFSGTQPVLGPVSGITFAANGTPQRFVFGSMVNSLYQTGGQGQGQNIYFKDLNIVAPTERYAMTANLDWKITPDTTASLMVNGGRLDALYHNVEYRNTGITIQSTNPFIPRSSDPTLDIPTILAANNLTSFKLGKGFAEIGPAPINTRDDLFRTVVSVDGKITGSWKWDAYYQYGTNSFNSATSNSVITSRITNALDAVRNPSGQIVCRINLNPASPTADPNCVPYNPFGQQASAAAMAYVVGTAVQTNKTTEHVAAANVHGDLFDMPAGPVAAAAGGEFRSDQMAGGADALSQRLAFFSGSGAVISGKIDVAEGYVESEVPLLANLPFAHALSLNGAARKTDYQRSSTGLPSSSVNVLTWKYGAVWDPIEAVRFRATHSRDIRAPNISELFGPNTSTQGILTDPARGGLQTVAVVVSGSNPTLKPESADTLTVGMVLKPSGEFLGRFRATIDYYDIKIKDAISNLGQQNIVTRCFQGDPVSCGLVQRDSSGNILQISDTLQNVNQLITRGIDFELDYHQPLNTLGSIDTQLFATYVMDLITVDAVGPTQRAGQTGLRAGTPMGIPDLTLDGLVTWNYQSLSLSAHGRYINRGFYNSAFIGPDQPGYSITLPNSSSTNDVPSKTYIGLTAQYRFNWGAHTHSTVFAGVDNVFDTDPPLRPGAHGTGNNVLFDPVGRTFKAGIRVSF